MSEGVLWIVYWSGWWVVLVVLSALDISQRNKNLQDCWWPCGVLLGWTWPVALTAFVAVYLPAKAIHRWVK